MRVLGISIVFAAAALIASTPASAQSFLGQWSATGKPPGGPETHELVTVTKTGETYSLTAKLVGDIAPGTPEAGPPGYDIVLDGDKFSYKRDIAIGGDTLVITYKGVVSGDIFFGTAELVGYEVPYTGVRVIPLPVPAGN